jgi:hypothetical protein
VWNQPLLIRVDQNHDSRVPLGRRVLRGRKHPEWLRQYAMDLRVAQKFNDFSLLSCFSNKSQKRRPAAD